MAFFWTVDIGTSLIMEDSCFAINRYPIQIRGGSDNATISFWLDKERTSVLE
jgi:hypothetical protein